MPCSSIYCINGAGSYDGNYGVAPTSHNGYDYFTGDTLPTYYIFSSVTENSWCLSTVLDGPCLLFGKSPCLSNCPDLCDNFFGIGPCLTPTPTPTPFCNVDFEAILDCAVTPTPTPTPTVTPTPTMTPTPSSTNPCGGISLSVTAITYTPTPTPTPSITPTQTPDITRPCNFTGVVTFNTIDDFLRCATSKKFRDCSNGFLFHSTQVILTPNGVSPTVGSVFRAVINGDSVCVVYDGQVENISGADDITLIDEIGQESLGGCNNCIPIPSQTPTPTPTLTPTPTPSQVPLNCFEYLIENLDPFSSNLYDYKDCSDSFVSVLIPASGSVTICASVAPMDSTFSITLIGPCLI
jgi:hypothetical protein